MATEKIWDGSSWVVVTGGGGSGGGSSSGTGENSHVEGFGTDASGYASHAEGEYTIASGEASHTEGSETQAIEYASHAEGSATVASGGSSHAEGYATTASGYGSHSEGGSTQATGAYAHAEGSGTQANGDSSHAEGDSTVADGYASSAKGSGTKANTYASQAMGSYNRTMSGSATGFISTADVFVIGNGTSGATSNALRVTFDGKLYALSAFNSSGADYAEYFEWLDQNIENEDRVGYFVTLDGDKIRKANSSDDYVLGIVSGNPSVIGDSASDGWANFYVRDEWGRIQHHNVEVSIINNKTQEEEIITEVRAIVNDEYDSSLEYIPREKRSEWSAIGMMGKLLVRDDGTCIVNSYCKSNDDGVATSSQSGYRVMKRISDNIIQILVK